MHGLSTKFCYTNVDVREAIKKILLGFLAVTLVMPALLFSRPEKVEALVSMVQCFTAKGAASGIASVKAAPGAIMSVSVSNISQNSETASAAAGSNWASCFMKSMTKIIAKTLLHTLTQSIVNWINTGFEGSPSFITNPEGFLADVADQTIGKIIQDISPFLCAPFRLNIKFALGLNMSWRTRETVTCRLSDVIANVQGEYDSFVSGTIGSGNLSKWIHIAGTQSNNPYGAYVAASYLKGASIMTATGQQIKLLDWGKGFKSWRSCEKKGPDVRDANNKVIRQGPCIKEGPIKTPGSIIEGQTTGALATTFQELELASEIDEVVGALINQLLTKVMTAGGGLLGASKGSITDGGVSATDALATDPTKAVSGADAKTPDGIWCNLRYYPATKETFTNSGFYIPDDGTTDPKSRQVWTDKLGNEPTTGSSLFVLGLDEKEGSFKKARHGTTGALILRPADKKWADYFETIRAGCANKWNALIEDAAAGGRGVFSGDTEGPGVPPPPPPAPPSEGRLSEGKLASQSTNCSTFAGYVVPRPLAGTALDGNTSGGDGNYPSFSCTNQSTAEWWQVDLETSSQSRNREWKESEVREILIYRPAGAWDTGAYHNTLTNGNFIVSLIDEAGLPTISIPISARSSSTGVGYKVVYADPIYTISLSPPVKGRYVKIAQNGPNSLHLIIPEVEVYGKQIRLDASGNTPAPSVPFSFTVTPAQRTMSQPRDWTVGTVGNALTGAGYGGDTFTWDNISFFPSRAQEHIAFRARYFRCTQFTACNDIGGTLTPYDKTPTDFFSNFSGLTFTYAVDGQPTTATMIESDETSGTNYTPAAHALNNTVDLAQNTGPADLLFAKDLALRNLTPIQVRVQGTPMTNRPFKIVINALDSSGSSVGTTTAEFTVQ